MNSSQKKSRLTPSVENNKARARPGESSAIYGEGNFTTAFLQYISTLFLVSENNTQAT